MRSLYARTILPVLPLLLDASASTIHCPIQGPEFPIPQRLSSSIFIQSAKDAFVTQLQSGAVPLNVSAFSVGVFSLDETEPLFEYHNSPPWVATSKDGVKKIDSNTVYRIASVSKLYTVWLLLIKAGEAILSDPITKYIPELATAGKSKDSGIQDGFDDIRQVKWDEMTVGDLARQISGIIRDPTSGDLSSVQAPWTSIGLPALNSSDIPTCNVNVTTPDCDRKTFFEYLLAKDAVYPVAQTPIYSNTNFALLGYVVEEIYGQTYSKALSLNVLEKLNLTHTSVSPPDSSLGVIPENRTLSYWDYNPEQLGPSGGIFTSTSDQIELGRAMLSAAFISPAQTRRWMRPYSRTSATNFMIGAPWEIFYIATGQNRGTEIYAKTGNLGAYNTVFGLIPDLGIGFTVNTAHGSESGTDASLTLAGLVMGNFLPAVQAEAKKQAAERFNGIYASQKSNQTITITVDDEAGLAASSPLFTNLIDLALGPGKLNSTQRLFPTGLRTTKQKTGRSDTYVSRLAFRAVIDSLGEEGQNEGVGFSVPCTAWAGVSGLMYGGVSLDEIIFELGEDGNATGITLPVLRETWERK